jgi:hypothetical protein
LVHTEALAVENNEIPLPMWAEENIVGVQEVHAVGFSASALTTIKNYVGIHELQAIEACLPKLRRINALDSLQ